MLKKRVNPRTKRLEYALVSVKNPKKVLQYFGKARPTEAQIAEVEKRIEHYATKGKP
jgi:hypothetical protein